MNVHESAVILAGHIYQARQGPGIVGLQKPEVIALRLQWAEQIAQDAYELAEALERIKLDIEKMVEAEEKKRLCDAKEKIIWKTP